MKVKQPVESDKITLTGEDVALVFGEKDSLVLYVKKSDNERQASDQLVLATILAYACVTENPIVNVAMKMVVDEYTREIEEQKEKK